MIRLKSKPTDSALRRLQGCANAIRQAESQGTTAPESARTCYRHPDVKASVRAETADKCAYCESKPRAVHWGDVEHIKPKSLHTDLALDYDNLTLACAVCNNRKNDYWSDAAPLLNPYEDDPSEHVVGLGVLVWQRNGSAIGERSVSFLDLNRAELVQRRQECIESLQLLVNQYEQEEAGPRKELRASLIREQIKDESEFALIKRWFLQVTTDLEKT